MSIDGARTPVKSPIAAPYLSSERTSGVVPRDGQLRQRRRIQVRRRGRLRLAAPLPPAVRLARGLQALDAKAEAAAARHLHVAVHVDGPVGNTAAGSK
jgi:hypothetical protein